MRRAGKAGGKYKNEFNIQYVFPDSLTGKISAPDLGGVQNLEIKPHKEAPSEEFVSNDNSVLPSSNSEDVQEVYEVEHLNLNDAKAKELLNWKRNNVYSVVPFTGQKLISVKWVHTFKKHDNGQVIPKARLVARGYEEDSSGIPKDSPTCSKDALRLMLSIISMKQWNLQSIDIKAAFLQGHDIARDVFLKPPPEANCPPGYVWKLYVSVYGLNDASLKWYTKVKNVLVSDGGIMSTLDQSLFYWQKGNTLIGIILVHVDDFLWAGSSEFSQTVIGNLRHHFEIGKEQQHCFRYLGLNISGSHQNITVDQNDYLKSLQPMVIDAERKSKVSEPLSPAEKEDMRSKIGQLLWLSNQTRPDLSFESCNLATKQKCATIKDAIMMNKTIKRAAEFQSALQFPNLDQAIKIVVYCDTSLGNLPDGGSQGGHLIFLVGRNGKCNLVSWQSKRLKRVARSSIAAETLSATDAIDAAVFLLICIPRLCMVIVISCCLLKCLQIVNRCLILCHQQNLLQKSGYALNCV